MAFIRCKKHPDIVMHRELAPAKSDLVGYPVYLPGLRCRVCQEIRPLKKEIQRLRVEAASSEHFPDPGTGKCMACGIYKAEGQVKLFRLHIAACRSCLGVIRTRLKAVHKLMEKRAKSMNEARGVRP